MRPRRTNRTGSDDGATINNRQNQSQKDTKLSASLTLWAEDNNIPAEDLARAYNIPLTATVTPDTTSSPLRSFTPEQVALFENESSKLEIGRYIAIDCEMVGVGEKNHESSALARVSVVNFHGNCVFDRFVKPKERVTDWRTWVSGVSPKNMENGMILLVSF
jgi:RNA exonuclease 4